MDLTLLWLWLSMWLLYWIYTTTGLTQGNTSPRRTIVSSGLLTLGAALVLHFIIVLVARTFWLTMTEELDPILLNFLLEVIRNRNYEPTHEDVTTEMGEFEPREGRGGPGTADVKFAIACPVYNYESGKVQVLQITQKSILKEIDQISQMEDYENLLEWDFTIGKKGSGLLTEYTVRPVPRKKGSQEHIDAAWLEAKSEGFDINRLIEGANPFKAA